MTPQPIEYLKRIEPYVFPDPNERKPGILSTSGLTINPTPRNLK
jgi:hypothetical protein